MNIEEFKRRYNANVKKGDVVYLRDPKEWIDLNIKFQRYYSHAYNISPGCPSGMRRDIMENLDETFIVDDFHGEFFMLINHKGGASLGGWKFGQHMVKKSKTQISYDVINTIRNLNKKT